MSVLKVSIFLLALIVGVGCISERTGQSGDPVESGDSCYSPTQNLDIAYDDGAVGCACAEGSEGQCLPDSGGRNVALVCEGGHWQAVEDGPCGL